MASWRQTYASAHRQQGGGDDDADDGGASSAPAIKFGGLEDGRKQQWKNFISGLEDDSDDDPFQEEATAPPAEAKEPGGGTDAAAARDAETTKSPAQWNGPGLMNSLYMQQLQGRGVFVGSSAPQSNLHVPAPVAPAALPSAMPLRDWITHHTSNNQTSFGHMGMGKSIDKGYLERGTRLALSLATNLDERYQTGASIIPPDDITVEKVMVVNTEDDEAEFVNTRTISDEEDNPTQRSTICALGRLYYEMFTQGMECPSSRKPEEKPPAPSQSSDPCSFDAALTISKEEGDGESDDQDGQRKQPRRVSDGDSDNHYNSLQLAGLPPSLCRLISDMLENDDSTEDLFRPDRSIAYLADVMSDLGQMVDDPNSFLHDSFLMRLEPVIPEAMYGREKELRQCLKVAEEFGTSESIGVDNSQSMLMVSGFSGSGKSRLTQEVITSLEGKGWRCLQCKFPQETKPQPLSTIASAFDRFLADTVHGFDSREQQEVKRRLVGAFDAGDILALCQHIPTLSKLVSVGETPLDPTAEISFSSGNAAASKLRLHRLFGLLLKALADDTHPMLVVLDDLQFADVASIELIGSLVEGSVCKEVGDKSTHMLFVGCYRNNEVEDGGPLATFIQQMRDCCTVALVDIHLEGLTREGVNDIVSNALFYPRRLTRPLSNLIHDKAAGSPLFTIEFLDGLASDNLLTYSLSQHKWLFDEDLILLKTVSDGVVDLLTRKLQRLPQRVIYALRILSCLGSESSVETLLLLSGACGSSIIEGLDSATRELLIKKKGNMYAFVHDVIERTVYEGIPQQEREKMLKSIADALAGRAADEGRDTFLFTIVDLVNRVGPENTPSEEDRVLYAELNLQAGELSIKTPDFASAATYLESGISFLNEGYWARRYNLSLALFKNAAFVHWALGQTDLMTRRINEVLINAKCYEDKLDSIKVLIKSSSINDASMEKGYEHCFAVLEYLGESLPDKLDKESIEREVKDTHIKLQNLPMSLDQLPIMDNPQKKQAMEFLFMALHLSYQQKSKYLAIVACRMVQLTIAHGRSIRSSLGLASMAWTFGRRNVDIAYQLGKAAMSLNSLPGCYSPEAVAMVLATVNVWKEPWQALLPQLLECQKMSMKCGETGFAGQASLSCVLRSFFSGTSLPTLETQVNIFLRLMSRYNWKLFYLYTMSVAGAISDLTGGPQVAEWDGVQGLAENDNNLSDAFEKKDICRAECIFSLKLMRSYIFRRMDTAQSITRQYQEFFVLHESDQPVNSIIRAFYTGLLALYSYRQAKEQYWMDMALRSIKMMKAWAEGCQWNFENKYLLLYAEYLFATGNFDRASEQYRLAISSAHDHRFVHEEAISMELAAHFHSERGNEDAANELMTRAVESYQSWGAEKKANNLLNAMQR